MDANERTPPVSKASSVKRYREFDSTDGAFMAEDANGGYVDFSDYSALSAENERMREEFYREFRDRLLRKVDVVTDRIKESESIEERFMLIANKGSLLDVLEALVETVEALKPTKEKKETNGKA